MDKILTWLCKEASEFDWQVVVLKAQDYRLAQQRTRVFLRECEPVVEVGAIWAKDVNGVFGSTSTICELGRTHQHHDPELIYFVDDDLERWFAT